MLSFIKKLAHSFNLLPESMLWMGTQMLLICAAICSVIVYSVINVLFIKTSVYCRMNKLTKLSLCCHKKKNSFQMKL